MASDKLKQVTHIDNVRLSDDGRSVVIIDQTRLPNHVEYITLHTAQEIWDAIHLLKVRGAPAIGIAAGYGIYVLAQQIETEDYQTFLDEFHRQAEYINSSRPTAVNLSWALRRMEQVVKDNTSFSVAEILKLLEQDLLYLK